MEASDYEELQPLLKPKREAKATQSTMFQDVFCVILLLFPGKDIKYKGNLSIRFILILHWLEYPVEWFWWKERLSEK